MSSSPNPDAPPQAAFIEPGDPRWSAVLERADHDVYHRPEYVALAAREEKGVPRAFWARLGDAEFLAPLVLRALPPALNAPPEWRDASSPYGYPTPVVTRGGEALAAPFMEALERHAREQGIVSLFLRLHPLLPLPGLEGRGTLVEHGPTVYMDLRRADPLLEGFRASYRTSIRKLRAQGYRTVLDDWSHYDAFIAAYGGAMARLGADASYYFSREYFAALRELRPGLHLCSVLAPDGTFAAGGLFPSTGTLIEYHLGATADEYVRVGPSKLMFLTVAEWGQANGCAALHLGGGRGAQDDSLLLFKQGFSRLTAPFRTLRLRVDPARYAELVRRWGGADETPGHGFFPRYRAAPPAQPAPG